MYDGFQEIPSEHPDEFNTPYINIIVYKILPTMFVLVHIMFLINDVLELYLLVC